MNLITLFIAFLRVGIFSFGGGYVLIPLIEQEVVANYGWLTSQEFTKILGISQVVPGAISVKFATYTGYKVGGVFGALAANLAILLPPAVLIILLLNFIEKLNHNAFAKIFLQGIKFGTFGLMAAITLGIGKTLHFELKGLMIALLALVLAFIFKIHPGAVIIVAGILGVLIY